MNFFKDKLASEAKEYSEKIEELKLRLKKYDESNSSDHQMNYSGSGSALRTMVSEEQLSVVTSGASLTAVNPNG